MGLQQRVLTMAEDSLPTSGVIGAKDQQEEETNKISEFDWIEQKQETPMQQINVANQVDLTDVEEHRDFKHTMSSGSTRDLPFDGICQSMEHPKVLVSVSSSIRRKHEPVKKEEQLTVGQKWPPSDILGVILAAHPSSDGVVSFPMKAITKTDQRPLRRFATLTQNERLLAKAVSNLISKDLTSLSVPPIISRLSRKRQRIEMERPATVSDGSKLIADDQRATKTTVGFEAQCETLWNKVVGKRNTRKRERLLSMMNHIDLTAASDSQRQKMMLTSIEGTSSKECQTTKRKRMKKERKNQVEQTIDCESSPIRCDRMISSYVPGVIPRFSRMSRKQQGSLQKEQTSNSLNTTVDLQLANSCGSQHNNSNGRLMNQGVAETSSSSILEERIGASKEFFTNLSDSGCQQLQEIMPAAFMIKSMNSTTATTSSLVGLSTAAMPQYFGNTSVQSTKTKPVIARRKKKKWK